jgi:hypothetical protein
MRKLLYGLMALLALGCNSKPSSDPALKTASGLNLSTSSLYAVPLDTAIKNIQRYHKNIKMYDSMIAAAQGKKPDRKIPMKAFTVRAADLFESMGMPVADTTKATYKHIRVYLAMNHKNEFKLYLTPVEGANLTANPPVAGKDIILKGTFLGLGSDGDYVLDFTQPCPTTCPTNSPLNN